MKPEKIIPKRISRAIMEYDMIHEGDRVLLALSGGKDSMVMAWFLNKMSRSFPTPFTVSAVHVSAPWEREGLSRWIEEKCLTWKIPYKDLPLSDFRESLRKIPDCSYCSRLRREALLTHAAREGYHSLALGHHMDDSLITSLVNMTYRGRIDPLQPRRTYPLTKSEGLSSLYMIRPLILLQEEIIESWALAHDGVGEKSNCPFESKKSRPIEMRNVLNLLCDGSTKKKRNLFKAFSNTSKLSSGSF